jgi:Ca2+-binding RTX toxin-like protein
MATIQGVYVALFGRPADPTGLTFFKGVSNDGADLSAIGDLSSTKEYTDRFVGQTNVQIINSIYQSLFGHPADAAGLNFFIGELLAGRQTIQTIAINILDGAQGTDKEIVDRKIAAADAFTAALDTTAEIVGYTGNAAAASGVAFLATVTATAPTAAQVDAAVAAAVAAGGGAAGNTFTLTTTVGESVMGTSADDTISASVDAAGLTPVPGAGAPSTLNATDMVDGAGGNDTINIIGTSAGAAPVPAGAIKNVEIVNLISDVAANTFAAGAAAVGTYSGVQQLWQINAAAPIAVTGVTDAVTVGFNGTGALADVQMATGATTANVALANVTALAPPLAMNIGETTAGTLTTVNVNGSIGGAGALNINLDAAASSGGVAASAETTLNLGLSAGTATVPAAIGVTSTTLKTIDASTSTGHLAITGTATTETLKGGSGNDTLTGAAASKLIEGGAGADTIVSGGVAGEVINGGAQGTVTNNAGAPPANLFDAITLSGGGVSEIVLTEAGHSGLTALTIDTIAGFVVAPGAGSDKLDFNLAAGSATNFLAGGPSSGVTDALTNANTAFDGTVQYFNTTDGAGNGLVFVDVDLDGTADMAVSLTAVPVIGFADIIA